MNTKTILLTGLALSIGLGSYFINDARSESYERGSSEHKPSIALVDDNTPLPTIQDGSVALSAAFENPFLLQDEQSEYVHLLVTAQGGISDSNTPRTPLNIAVVLDRSGSMSSENKLEYAKSACQLVLDNLSSTDRIGLVAYDDAVNLIQPSGPMQSREYLKSKVASLQPGGSTNLSGGMLEGYAQVNRSLGEQSINRVLLLSDGLANQGITDLAQLQRIVEEKFSQRGMAISTFGVGADYNEDLMTNLAEYGRGNYHFIESADQIPGIFADELEGLLNVVAQNTTLQIQFPSTDFTVDKVYGYPSEVNGDVLSINYNDVIAEEEKTVLVRFKRKRALTQAPSFSVSLSYDDVNENYKRIGSEMNLALELTSDKELYASKANDEVARNIVLFESLDRFEMAAKEVDKGNYEEAKRMIRENEEYMDREFTKVAPDSAMQKQYEVNKSYRKDIDDIESKSQYEVKMMQKSNKSSNYMMRKKK